MAFPAAEGLSYDVVVAVDDKLLRCQVKATRKPKAIPQRKTYTPAYLFFCRRMGKLGRRSYAGNEFDFMALVALDIKAIAYIKLTEAKQSVQFNREKMTALSDIARVL